MTNRTLQRHGSSALLTDLYELTMAHGYWRLGMSEQQAVFHLTFRENPFRGSHAIACGLQHLCDMLADFSFSPTDIDYLAALPGNDSRPLFGGDFLEYLGGLRLTCDLDAVEEGTMVFPHEPLLRVRGPILQAQILESLLLNVINFQTLIATKAARICRAASPGTVLEFGLRRAQGESGAMVASRAAYIGGCAATSNVLAGKHYGIPVRGTHAHSWVMSFGSELEAFTKYAESMPNNCIFLVDTFDSLQGVRNAIAVARRMHAQGCHLVGIRLDSGDLATLSRQARQMLDEARMPDTLIVASNDLDEYEIERLRARGAAIDVWGVGTRLVTAYDQPALGGVYKLSALQSADGRWQRKMKVSEQPLKVSTPGLLQTRRYRDHGRCVGDIIFDELTGMPAPAAVDLGDNTPFVMPASALPEDLLVPVLRRGEVVYQFPSIHDSRERVVRQREEFPELGALVAPSPRYRVGLEVKLQQVKLGMMGAAGGASS